LRAGNGDDAWNSLSAQIYKLAAGLIKELFRSENYECRFPASRGARLVIEGRVNQAGYSLLRPLVL
jgi:hypothetical protein